MFQSWLRRAAFHQPFFGVKCVHVGRTGKEWNVNFLPMILLAERKFLNFFLVSVSHMENLSEEDIKRRSEGN